MTDSPFRRKNLGEHQLRLVELATHDADKLHARAHYVAPGRYRSLFVTHLETAMMFLNKAIAFDGVTELPTADDAPSNSTEENVDG